MKKAATILTLFILIFSGCEKDSGTGLEIYTLKDYETKSNSHEIIQGSEKLTKDPVIYYGDIIYYDSADHFFVIDSIKARKLSGINWPTGGTPFALAIDRNVIYSGYFIPGYSSSGSDWYSIDPINIGGRLRVSLGYPGDRPDFKDPDRRNDSRIINLLRQDNKLR